jgi:hypothetical protein
MHQGVINRENFGEICRQISQKRKHGTLEITLPDRLYKISFGAGKIVEVIDGPANPLEEIISILKHGNLLPPSFVLTTEETYKDLALTLAEVGTGIDEKLLKRVARHRVFDKLYSLDLQVGAFYTFRVEMVDIDREFSPSISVGQLLLDLVALDNDRASVREIFGEGGVVRTDEDPDTLSEEEAIIYDALTTRLPVDRLRMRSMVSEYHFNDALLALHKRNLVEPSFAAQEAAAAAERDLFAALDSMGEEFSQGVSQILGAPSEVSPLDEDVFADEPAPEEVPLKSRLNQLSLELTTVTWIPHLVVWCFILLAVLSPLFFWADVLEQYRHS